MSGINQTIAAPRVRLVGQFDHPDFADAVKLLRDGAEIVTAPDAQPELIVVAQSRPGVISEDNIQLLRRDAPLSGVVALLGTWCEGETRTGRPWPGVDRLYWYEFPPWWHRQLAHRAAGRCPDWAQPANFPPESPVTRNPGPTHINGLVILCTPVRETAAALADVLRHSGYATVWRRPGRPGPVVRGATVGIWDGGQLSDHEEISLAAFCRDMARDRAPVIALLDFPRRDRAQRARQLGAAAILGKPWLNVDLIATIEDLRDCRDESDKVVTSRAA